MNLINRYDFLNLYDFYKSLRFFLTYRINYSGLFQELQMRLCKELQKMLNGTFLLGFLLILGGDVEKP
mgnify:CR=1 FL=1